MMAGRIAELESSERQFSSVRQADGAAWLLLCSKSPPPISAWSPLNNQVRQTRSAGHNLKPCRDSGEQRQGWPASRYVSAIVGQLCFDLTTRPPLTKHNGTAPIQADDVKRVLADIDAGYRDCRMSFSDMACSFVSLEAPLASFDRWRSRSTAGPSRSQTPS